MGLVNDNSFINPYVGKQKWGMEVQEYGTGTGSSQSTEDEASWI